LKAEYTIKETALAVLRKQVNADQNKLKDLTGAVKEDKRRMKEMKSGLMAEAKADARGKIKEEEEEVRKEKNLAAAEKQKREWDQLSMLKAKVKLTKAKQKLKEAGIQDAALKEQSDATRKTLEALKKTEKDERTKAESTVENLTLASALERVKKESALDQTSAVQARAALKVKEFETTEKAKIKSAETKAAAKVQAMQKQMVTLKETFQTKESLEKAAEAKKIAEIRMRKNKELAAANLKTIQEQTLANKELSKISDLKESSALLKDEMKSSQTKLGNVEDAKRKEEEFFKMKIKEDAARILARAGVRTMAQAQKQQLDSANAALAIKTKALHRATDHERKLAEKKDHLQKLADQQKRKLEEAEFRVSQHEKKSQDLEIALEKLKLQLDVASKHAKNEEALRANLQKNEGEEDMERKYKSQVKETEALKAKMSMEQAKNQAENLETKNWEAKSEQYKEQMEAALEHSRRIAEQVRTTWANKLIAEQTAHTLKLEKLKHEVETQRAKYDASVRALQEKSDAEETEAEKAEAKAANEEEMAKYIGQQVGQQEVQTSVLRNYMEKEGDIRAKYNKRLEGEHKEEIKRLKSELDAYKGGREIAKMKYNQMLLEQKLEESKQQRFLKIQTKKESDLDVNILLASAIAEAQKGSDGRSVEDNRKRMVNAVNAVVKMVMGADKLKGIKLADKAIALEEKSGKLKPDQPNSTVEKPVDMTPKQLQLWDELHSLVKMSALPPGSIDMKTGAVSARPMVDAAKELGQTGEMELQKGAFLRI